LRRYKPESFKDLALDEIKIDKNTTFKRLCANVDADFKRCTDLYLRGDEAHKG
jgi:hypothetical protein